MVRGSKDTEERRRRDGLTAKAADVAPPVDRLEHALSCHFGEAPGKLGTLVASAGIRLLARLILPPWPITGTWLVALAVWGGGNL